MSYPEHDKLVKVLEQSKIIGRFLDWLVQEKEIIMSQYNEEDIENYQIWLDKPKLLAEFFNIDFKKTRGRETGYTR